MATTCLRIPSCRQRRFKVYLLLTGILLTAIMTILFGSGTLMPMDAGLTLHKRSSLPCNSSSSSLVKLVQCASSPNECILATFVCDIIPDCSDQSDESNATCRGIPSCKEQGDETCLNNGYCVSHPRTTSRVAYHSCNCTATYTGRYCEVPVPTTPPHYTTELDRTTEAVMSSPDDIMTTANDGSQTALPHTASSQSPTLSGVGTEIRNPSTPSTLIYEYTPTTNGATTLDVVDDASTTDSAAFASTVSQDSGGTEASVVRTSPATVTFPTKMAQSTAKTFSVTAISQTTDADQGETLTTNSNPSSMSSSSSSVSSTDVEEMSTASPDQLSTSVDNAAITLVGSSTDASFNPTEDSSSSSTAAASSDLVTSGLSDTSTREDTINPNPVSVVCDEVDLIFLVVECATPRECIFNVFICDGVSDCNDGSDESPATCNGEPACEGEPGDTCQNGGTCVSNPMTGKRVAHITCMCTPMFTGDRCLEEAIYTTSSLSSLSSTVQTSTSLLTTPFEVPTSGGTPATVLVTQGFTEIQSTNLLVTTTRDITAPEATTHGTEASTLLTSITTSQTISKLPTTEELTTENTVMMTSSDNNDVPTSEVYTERTVTIVVSSLTTQIEITDTEFSSDVPWTPTAVNEIITTPLPLPTDLLTQTGTSTTDTLITTEEVGLLGTDMVTDHLATEPEGTRTDIATDIITVIVSSGEGSTTTGSPDISTGSDLFSVVTTNLPAQLTSLKALPTTSTSLDTSQTITYTEGAGTEIVFSTVTVPGETTESPTVGDTQPLTEQSTMAFISDALVESTMTTDITEATSIGTVTSEVMSTADEISSHSQSSAAALSTTRSEAPATTTDDITTDATFQETISTTVSTDNDITTLYIKATTHATSEVNPTDDDFLSSGASTRLTSADPTSTTAQEGSESPKSTTQEASTSFQNPSSRPAFTTSPQIIYSTKSSTTEHMTSLEALKPEPEVTDPRFMSTSTTSVSSLITSSTIDTTEDTYINTVEASDESTTKTLSSDTLHSASSSPLSTTLSSTTTTGNREASAENVVLKVLTSTVSVVLILIVCLVIVGCCIARKWRERNPYPDDDQTPLRSHQTYSRQSNRGLQYSIDNFENNKPSFVHRLKPFQSTKLDNETDVEDDSSHSMTTLSIINDYFEQIHGSYDDRHEPDGGSEYHQQSRDEKLNNLKEKDFASDSFELKFFPDTEYWMPPSTDVDDIPYYITDDTPLPVSHV